MYLIVLLALTLLEVASAQSTWKGLRFGASEADVRKEYEGTLQKKLSDDGRLVLVDVDQKLADQRATADLHFDKNGKLTMIELYLKDPFAAERRTDAIGSSFAVITVLGNSLAEKYGKPVTEEGECRLSIEDVVNNSQKIFSCNKMWRSGEQTISLYWSIRFQRLFFYGLDYKPLPSEI